MKNNQISHLHIKIDRGVYGEYFILCKDNGTTVSEEIRRFIYKKLEREKRKYKNA